MPWMRKSLVGAIREKRRCSRTRSRRRQPGSTVMRKSSLWSAVASSGIGASAFALRGRSCVRRTRRCPSPVRLPLGEPRSDFSCLSFSARRYSLCSFGRSRLLISIASPFRMSDNVTKSTAIYESVTFRYEVLESVMPPPAIPTLSWRGALV